MLENFLSLSIRHVLATLLYLLPYFTLLLSGTLDAALFNCALVPPSNTCHHHAAQPTPLST